MKRFLTRLGAYFVSMGAVIAAIESPGFVSISGAAVAVLSYVALELWFTTRKMTPHDQDLFTKFKTLFPSSSGYIILIQDHDFGGDFEHRMLDPLHDFIHEWQNEEHKFHDAELNAALDDFSEKMVNFSREIGSRTSPSRVDVKLQSAKVGEGYNGGGDERRTKKNAKVLNDLASQCYELHQAMMKC
jgi:hypothetical protein